METYVCSNYFKISRWVAIKYDLTYVMCEREAFGQKIFRKI